MSNLRRRDGFCAIPAAAAAGERGSKVGRAFEFNNPAGRRVLRDGRMCGLVQLPKQSPPND
jgi:hypothetical protein